MSYQQYRDRLNREYGAYTQLELEGIGAHARFHYQRAWLGQVLFRCGSNSEEAVQSVQGLLEKTRDKEKKAYLEIALQELRASLKAERSR